MLFFFFSLIKSKNFPFFFKGGISVSEVLDYELCKKFFLVVEAKDGGTPALSAVATVSINLTDVNDNPPRFSQDVYSAVISEDALVGDSVILVGASGWPRCLGLMIPNRVKK